MSIIHKVVIDIIDFEVDILEVYNVFAGSTTRRQVICPFHDDHSPSAKCYEDTNKFFCFTCGISLGVFDFVRRINNWSYQYTIEYFKTNYSLDLDVDTTQLRMSITESLKEEYKKYSITRSVLLDLPTDLLLKRLSFLTFGRDKKDFYEKLRFLTKSQNKQ